MRFHIELRRRSLRLAGDHAKANDEIERRQRGKDPRTVKAHLKTGLAQEHADVDRVAREAFLRTWSSRQVYWRRSRADRSAQRGALPRSAWTAIVENGPYQ